MFKNKFKLRYWILPIFWMGLIFMFSHQPATQSGKLSSSITEKVLQVLENFVPNITSELDWWHGFIRKNAHFFIYFILGILLMNPLKKSQVKRPYTAAFVISALYAVSDETHQLFIEGRVGTIYDVLIDTSGALTGLLLYKTYKKITH
ncbi:VanZ family protein [Vallitaleaceae bacterium 9-2]